MPMAQLFAQADLMKYFTDSMSLFIYFMGLSREIQLREF
jgi:hypothetical protein